MNQFWTFQCIFLNNFKDLLEVHSLLKIYKIVLEYTLKCSQLISYSDNKKILLTTRNVRKDSGCYATKYYYRVKHLKPWIVFSTNCAKQAEKLLQFETVFFCKFSALFCKSSSSFCYNAILMIFGLHTTKYVS